MGWWDWKSGKGWEKDIFSRNSEGALGNFSVRFCGIFVLPCLAVLVPGGALATLLLAAAAEAAAATAVLVRGCAFGQQQQQVSWWEIEKAEKVGKKTFFQEFRRDVRHFFGAILGPVRPSVPCCFGAGRCSCYSSGSSSSNSRWADGIEKAACSSFRALLFWCREVLLLLFFC